MDNYDVLIVGAGHAGSQCAIDLRKAGYGGSVAIVSEEPHLPYERPPLSKDYFTGHKTFEQLQFRPLKAWEERHIILRLGERVRSIDAARNTAELSTGDSIHYGKLVWAAGGDPRRMACIGSELSGIHMIRKRSDVDALRADIEAAEHVVVIGGGFVGLEVAAALTKLGMSKITVIEAFDRLLARVTTGPLSDFMAREHRAHGVEVCLGSEVIGFTANGGHVSGVTLKDGRAIPADLVIIGIGIAPAISPLTDAGASGKNGLDVDEFCRTTLDNVYAIGDCARRSNRFAQGNPVRIESVPNAVEQAAIVAAHITGIPGPKTAVPWFWSNQYDLRLQMAGISTGHDDLVVRGDPDNRSFSVIYLLEGRVIAIDCVNAAKDFLQAKPLIESGAIISRADLADVSLPLKSMSLQSSV